MSEVKFASLAVIGAGPSGLILARILQHAGRDVVVFEKEPFSDSRPQGGTLDMHSESGQWALEKAGLTEEFLKLARPEGQDFRICDKRANFLWDERGRASMERPEIDREKLRHLLIQSLKEGTIRWGHALQSVRRIKNGEFQLTFDGDRTITVETLVGADGTWSRVRSLLTDAKPAYTGVSFVQIKISNVDERFPSIASLVGHGSLFALEDNKGLFAQRNGDGSIRVYVAMRMPEHGFAAFGITFGDPPETRRSLLSHFQDWAPELQYLIKSCDDTSFVPWPVTAMPVGLRWTSQGDVTLVGDAAHQMSPFAGAGANLALQDGAALAVKLLECTDVASAIAAYESEMFERAARVAQQSAEGLEVAIAPDGAVRLQQAMKNVMKQQANTED